MVFIRLSMHCFILFQVTEMAVSGLPANPNAVWTRHTDERIRSCGRPHERGATAGLRVTRSRIEPEPDGVAPLRQVHRAASRCGVASCWPSSASSTAYPPRTATARTAVAGSRTARLFPHFRRVIREGCCMCRHSLCVDARRRTPPARVRARRAG